MLFNSYQFWIFFAVVMGLYWRLNHVQQNRMLLVASYVFYGFWDWRFLSLILLSTGVDFVVGHRLALREDPRQRRHLLLCSLGVNLGLLGVFKYYDFFVGEMGSLLTMVGLPAPLSTLGLILPVGISFYTFQTLSFSIDVYRRKTHPPASFLDFALYVAFFPQLVAGPIERSSRFLPQILTPRTVTKDDFREGLHEILLGMVKKVVIADNAAPIVFAVFSQSPEDLSGADALVGIYAFALQIYGDFSGYSSIAIGVARWLGFDLMTNFRVPYFATSIQDFWRRWHISLSTWLRDYLYISLGGSRGTRLMTYRNLMATMVLGGIWHGAAWTFVFWGLYHGALLAVHRLWTESAPPGEGTGRLGTAIRVIGTFHLVCVGWLLFRAETMSQVYGFLAAIATNFQITEFSIAMMGTLVLIAGPILVYEYVIHRNPEGEQHIPQTWWVRGTAYSYFILLLLFCPAPVSHAFIYFQF